MEEILGKLQKEVRNIFESEKYKNYLKTMSKFTSYSFRNTLLILAQKPDASHVAGYVSWIKNFGRQVRKGEKGIKIIAPSPYKTTVKETKLSDDGTAVTEEKEVSVNSFKVSTVFDISQTEGKDLPTPAISRLYENVKDYENFFEALKTVSPVPIEFESMEGAKNGYFHPLEKRIAVRENMSQAQNVKTAVHEIAHAKLHNFSKDDKNIPDKQTREVQAESVAYAVCCYYGIDTSEYSFGYIASWSGKKELPELNASLQIIQSTAGEIISGIDRCLAERENSQQICSTEALRHKEEIGL